ncbi:MAG: LPS assembly lipoprotein LptE [Desulfarculales bacterium]|jgi:outer membrane lipopolysaccharide assembly protein LptE/RlpB|nr:LPS assembly lipoprotein LptE [Desulfarculales bacterium]
MRRLLLCLFLSLLVAGCGYSFRHNRSNLPEDIKTISIPMFSNMTNEIRLEAIVTEQMRYQFTQSRILKMVPEAEADVVLIGSIIGVYADDVSLTEWMHSSQRRVSITISARLLRAGSGEVLYQGSVQQQRSYSLEGANASATEARTEALKVAARDAAQTIHDGVLQNF